MGYTAYECAVNWEGAGYSRHHQTPEGKSAAFKKSANWVRSDPPTDTLSLRGDDWKVIAHYHNCIFATGGVDAIPVPKSYELVGVECEDMELVLRIQCMAYRPSFSETKVGAPNVVGYESIRETIVCRLPHHAEDDALGRPNHHNAWLKELNTVMKTADNKIPAVDEWLTKKWAEHRHVICRYLVVSTPQANEYDNKGDFLAALFWSRFLFSMSTPTVVHVEDKTHQEMTYGRWLARKIGYKDDRWQARLDQMIDFLVECTTPTPQWIKYLSHEDLVPFFAAPYGISSCMSGHEKQYCVNSYRYNPNCGMAIAGNKKKVFARALVYRCDSGVKGHCNVYQNNDSNFRETEFRDGLREAGFVDLRRLYGLSMEHFGGGPRNSAARCDCPTVGEQYSWCNSASSWVDENPLPDECVEEFYAMQRDLSIRYDEGEDQEADQNYLWEWVTKWFSLTFVTDENWAIPFFDCFGMWRVDKGGKNLQLTALPIRANLGFKDFSDRRTPRGPGVLYRAGSSNSRKWGECFTLHTAEEIIAGEVPLHPQANEDDKMYSWVRCDHSGKFFREDCISPVYQEVWGGQIDDLDIINLIQNPNDRSDFWKEITIYPAYAPEYHVPIGDTYYRTSFDKPRIADDTGISACNYMYFESLEAWVHVKLLKEMAFDHEQTQVDEYGVLSCYDNEAKISDGPVEIEDATVFLDNDKAAVAIETTPVKELLD